MKLSTLFNNFFHSEKSGGVVLVICTALSLLLTNSPLQDSYLSIWNYEFASHSVTHWINDGLMAIFFLLIGLELEREVYIGELSDLRNSLLPIFGAVGGMIVPAGIYLAINHGTAYQDGAGIPMATDIAFALGILSLVGKNVPASLKIFLTALAVIDDLGAILVIAIFYTGSINWINLGIAFGLLSAMFILNRIKVYNLIPYLIGGIVMWYFMLNSGIHATITGVLLAFVIPFGDGSEKSPSYILQNFLHYPVAFVILPVFALANTSLPISPHWYHSLLTSNSLGISLGLLIGKPIGITSFSFIAIRSKLSVMPDGIDFKKMAGVSFLGGIGFTMSIFITLLAFEDKSIIDQSKVSIMIASLMAGTVGYLLLKLFLKKPALGPPGG